MALIFLLTCRFLIVLILFVVISQNQKKNEFKNLIKSSLELLYRFKTHALSSSSYWERTLEFLFKFYFFLDFSFLFWKIFPHSQKIPLFIDSYYKFIFSSSLVLVFFSFALSMSCESHSVVIIILYFLLASCLYIFRVKSIRWDRWYWQPGKEDLICVAFVHGFSPRKQKQSKQTESSYFFLVLCRVLGYFLKIISVRVIVESSIVWEGA